MLGIVGGTSLLYSRLPPLKNQIISTPYGRSEVKAGEGFVILLRHQGGRPPHRINFRSHIAALAILGVDRIVSIGSTGSLKPNILPGFVLIPTDYVSMLTIPTIHDNSQEHVYPGLDQTFGKELARLVSEAKYGGVYAQTHGPRIETEAEVRALAGIADIVGMTLANEATLACELGIPFAALCTVDNFANGLAHETLTFESILSNSKKYSRRSEMMVETIMNKWA